MPTKEEAKQQLASLISEFNSHPKKDTLSEEETREFISELFKILDWNFKTWEVTQEEKVSKGYVASGKSRAEVQERLGEIVPPEKIGFVHIIENKN